MRMLIVIALALALGAAFVWAADFEPGFVLLQYRGWSMETSLVVFSILLMLFVLGVYLLLRSVAMLRQVPGRFAIWRQVKKLKRANRDLTRGLITLEEGRWAEAERLLVRHAGNSDTPLLHYLAAARAAQKQGIPERRDNYLRLAHETTAGADIAVGVVQAELQLSAGQKEQALATLQHLREMAPKHPYVLQLLQSLYQDMEQWQEVQAVLPDLRRRHVLPADEVAALGVDAAVGQLQAALHRRDWNRMAEIWEKVPARTRHSEALLKPYLAGLLEQGEQDPAAVLIEQFLRRNWSDELAYLYGHIATTDPLKRLARAEKWLADRPDNPWLLLTLGRLAKAANLWTKAAEYLRASLRHGPRGESYRELADVLLALGEKEEAARTCRAGLDLMLKPVDGRGWSGERAVSD